MSMVIYECEQCCNIITKEHTENCTINDCPICGCLNIVPYEDTLKGNLMVSLNNVDCMFMVNNDGKLLKHIYDVPIEVIDAIQLLKDYGCILKFQTIKPS